MEETFAYDDMNRLTGITLKRPSGQDLQCSVTYDALGRMTSRQAVTSVNGSPQVTTVFSQPVFDATKVHATTLAQSMAELFPSSSQTVAYTGFDKANVVWQGNDSICYSYGYDHQRINIKEVLGGNLRTKDYVGNCEYVAESNGSIINTQWLTYLSGPTGLYAVVVTKSGSDQIFYVLKDNLESWTAITDGDGSVKQELSYDAWGNYRDPDTWATYTAADPFVQTPDFTQSFNRYSYCMNNPVMYSDPDGEFLGIPMLGLAFVAELTSNLINGIENPVQTAWNNATATVNGMDNCLQFSVPLGENTHFNFGISPFSIGANAGISYNNGTSSFSIGGGYGVLSGPYGYFSGSQTIGDATVSFIFGKGSNYYGWNMAYTYKGYGIGYGRTYYGNAIGLDEIPNPQITGTPSIYFKNGSFRLENDYFGDAHDRWRTNAWELTIGDFTLGSTIYTNNPEEMGYGTSNEPSPLWGYNRPDKHDKTKEYQAWNNGFVFDCPLWIGWRHGNSISRVGYRHPVFQDATQNFVHKYCDFGRMHFYINYQQFTKDRLFYGGGYYNPFSLY